MLTYRQSKYKTEEKEDDDGKVATGKKRGPVRATTVELVSRC